MANNTARCITKPKDWEPRLLGWLDFTFPHFSYHTGNHFKYPYGTFPNTAFGAFSSLSMEEAALHYNTSDLVALIGYDYKNNIERLSSQNKALIDLESAVFFKPELSIEVGDQHLNFKGEACEEFITSFLNFEYKEEPNPEVKVKGLDTAESYQDNVKKIQNHIREGDIYELNYCISFSFEETQWNPINGFLDLMQKSPMPFSGMFKSGGKYLLSASPERFIKKMGKKLIAQPIKGTIKRGASPEEDESLKEQLLGSEKERAENLMIVDLMRNDMSKISETGSVQVEELFGIYSFPRVHQMISTVSSQIQDNLGLLDLIHATFPMGSMTGAPKIKCMELIECYENFKRGWFSGSFGLFESNGDFDLNVVIRSILYDKESGKGYFAVGSAITYDADPAYEYKECLLKASAILEILEGK
ncbi:anthranilate synthase component I family protein [Mongoliibacter ruber]|uniref:Para-aminobenzoate synthetase component 1 n=1 Tax=Mongoliibacter ruber TaxID=1750599 RepID=A0A2T0WK51_9BACT|nr:anthranilate synthase component I family protein [Mongoliibacter ruber]PRY87032.1 para-aminobenzoate synthetase component 1 [Mongoliibacter ruber]